MPDVRFKLPDTETVTLTGQTIDKLIREGDADAALLYLYILRTNGQSSSSDAAAALSKSSGDIALSMSALVRMGVVQITNDDEEETAKSNSADKNFKPTRMTDVEYLSRNENQSKNDNPGQSDLEPPDLSEEEIRAQATDEMKQELESGSIFSGLVGEAQRSLGKILTPDELLRLFGIYDNLRMEPEVILHLITHCITESRGRSNGRMPSLRYIEKAAYTWEREGIVTLDCAEKYIKELEIRRSARGEIKDALQIRNRELSETEKRYVDNWIAMNFDPEAIAIAYDRTVMQTGKLAWKYMDKIIGSWYEKGLHTADDIMKKDSLNEKAVRAYKKPSEQKFNSSDLEEVARMQRMLGKKAE